MNGKSKEHEQKLTDGDLKCKHARRESERNKKRKRNGEERNVMKCMMGLEKKANRK